MRRLIATEKELRTFAASIRRLGYLAEDSGAPARLACCLLRHQPERAKRRNLFRVARQHLDQADRRVARRPAAALIFLKCPLAAADDDAGLFLGQSQLFAHRSDMRGIVLAQRLVRLVHRREIDAAMHDDSTGIQCRRAGQSDDSHRGSAV
jgi:hypothetical protein